MFRSDAMWCPARRACLYSVVSTLLSGCFPTIDNFAPRLSAGGESYQRTIVNEVLVNIVRSGYNDATSFVAAGKFTSANNISIGLTLPSVSVGGTSPAAANFSGNSFKSDNDSSIDATTLNTRKFQNGFYSQITYDQFSRLIARGFSRELLFNLFVDSIRLRDAKTGRERLVRNNPSLDLGQACRRFDYTGFVDGSFDSTDDSGPYSPDKDPRDCEYHQFQYFSAQFMKYGYAIEFLNQKVSEIGSPGSGTSDRGAKIAASPRPRFCYDLARTSPAVQSHLLRYNPRYRAESLASSPICGSKPIGDRETAPVTFQTTRGNLQIYIWVNLRSPAAAFAYLGNMVVDGSYDTTELFEAAAHRSSDHRIFALERGRTTDCYAIAPYMGVPYCVPVESDASRAAVSALAFLVQESTDREDVPTNNLTVRVTP